MAQACNSSGPVGAAFCRCQTSSTCDLKGVVLSMLADFSMHKSSIIGLSPGYCQQHSFTYSPHNANQPTPWVHSTNLRREQQPPTSSPGYEWLSFPDHSATRTCAGATPNDTMMAWHCAAKILHSMKQQQPLAAPNRHHHPQCQPSQAGMCCLKAPSCQLAATVHSTSQLGCCPQLNTNHMHQPTYHGCTYYNSAGLSHV